MQLEKDLIADLARKGLIGFMGLDLMEDGHRSEIRPFKDEGLTHQIIGRIPQIFRGEGRLVDALEAWICPLDDVLLDQVACHLSFDEERARSNSVLLSPETFFYDLLKNGHRLPFLGVRLREVCEKFSHQHLSRYSCDHTRTEIATEH